MRTITLIRQPAQGNAVHGTLSFELNGTKRTFPSLENANCIIPAGTYKVEYTWSPRFKKPLPEILNVPNRSGIRIHRGTLPEHSHGCILTDMAGISFLQILFNQQIIAKDEHENEENYEPEETRITILDGSPA